ncbi:MAG: ribosome biogenesis GTP-binding protein YihA/YsxC, partial [Oleiharenicola lentus]
RLPLAEFAFIGRSNVGKSSLLNLLAEKRDLARVSDLPGKTQLMNFYTMNLNWRLVDLPGYGYAHVAKTKRADFNEAAADYIEHRENLKAVFVLIDPRHEPHAIDLSFMEWIIETGVPFAVVFTKTDKQSPNQTQVGIDRFIAAAGLDQLDPAPDLFATSAKTKAGRMDILKYIAARL